jgi:hypothetical protein
MSKLETNTIDNISGSSTLTIGSTNTTTVSIPEDVTLGASGKTITIPSGATITNNGTQSGFGDTNKYEFYAYQNSAQSLSSGAFTTIQFDTESFDSDSKYSTSTYTYSPGEAGFYHVGFSLGINSSSSFSVAIAVLIKNTSTELARARRPHRNHDAIQNYQASTIVQLGASDTLKVQSYQNFGSAVNSYNSISDTYFWGYKLIT